VGLYIAGEIIALAPALIVGLLIAAKSPRGAQRQVGRMVVAAVLVGGVALEILRWYSWWAVLGLAAVVAAFVSLGVLIVRSLASRPAA